MRLLVLSLLLGLAGPANATTAILDLGDITRSTNVDIVPNADGRLTSIVRAGVQAMQTGGVQGNRYLYLHVKDGLFDASNALWVRVDYFDEGNDNFELDYNGVDRDDTGTVTGKNPVKIANPDMKAKFDSRVWLSQVFKLPDFQLRSGMAGKADIRIDDKADGPEIIGKITLTDEEPQRIQIPYVNPAKPIVIDGVKSDGEWDGALSFTLDKPEYDAENGLNWNGTEDFSGVYSYEWDERGLYVLGDVTDATPRLNDADPPAYWSGDGIELYIGLRQDNPNRSVYETGTDFHVVISLGDNPGWAVAHGTVGLPIEDKGRVPTQNLAIVQTDQGYRFELLLPWSLLTPGATVTAGQEIGWSMFANNGRSLPSSQDVAMSPFGRKNMFRDPSGWVTATLEPSKRVENPPANPSNGAGQ